MSRLLLIPILFFIFACGGGGVLPRQVHQGLQDLQDLEELHRLSSSEKFKQ